jgi:hypothetical protein
MQVGDSVVVQGMPGTIVRVNTQSVPPLYLVMIETPSIRWFTAEQVAPPSGPGAPPGPAGAPPGPAAAPPAAPQPLPPVAGGIVPLRRG